MITWKLWTSVPTVALWEAVALVVGLEPSEMVHHPNGWMAGPGRGPVFSRSSFPNAERQAAFDKALGFAERAANAAGPIVLRTGLASGMNRRTAQVSLSEVVAFFVSCEWSDIPAPLLALVAQVESGPDESESESAFQKRWNPGALEELRAYREKHGTQKAAEWAQISESRVRQLLPGDKPARKGFGVFTHHLK